MQVLIKVQGGFRSYGRDLKEIISDAETVNE